MVSVESFIQRAGVDPISDDLDLFGRQFRSAIGHFMQVASEMGLTSFAKLTPLTGPSIAGSDAARGSPSPGEVL